MAVEKVGALDKLEEVLKGDINNSQPNLIQSSLLAKKDDAVLCWSETEKCLFSCSADKDTTQQNIQKLSLSTSPLFGVTHLKCNLTGNHALVYGPDGLIVVEIPRCWKDAGVFEGGKEKIHCRSTLLDEAFFNHHVSCRVVQASWYPGSPSDTHIVVLTSDNCLRFYDLSMPKQPMLCLPLFDSNTSSFGGNTFGHVLGDIAAGFDIAEPTTDGYGNQLYPIYIMQESGDVWVLHCKFSQNRLHVEQQGPLTMNPPADDNYGCNYCSVLCLTSTPTTLVMITRSGTIYHCLVIVDEENGSDLDDLNETKERFPTEALYVYESVQLELNFLHSDGEEDAFTNQQLSNFILQKDLVTEESYIAICNGGVHTVSLPWLHELDEFLSIDGLITDGIQSPASIQYVLCTQPSDDSPVNSVCGCVVLDIQATTMVFLLSSGELICLSKQRSIENSWTNIKRENRTKVYTSPLRQLHGVGQFNNFISKILTKKATLPVIKCGASEDLIPADVYYSILTKTTRILREEYIQKMIHAKSELEKRCKILKEKKEDQLQGLEHLQNNRVLSEMGEELAFKLETAQENMKTMTDRVAKLLRNIQTSSPVLSNAEKEWGRELNAMKEKVNKLRRLSEIVNTKHENLVLQTIPSSSLSRTKPVAPTNFALPGAQAIKVRAVLKDQGTVISKLVEDVQTLSIRVGN